MKPRTKHLMNGLAHARGYASRSGDSFARDSRKTQARLLKKARAITGRKTTSKFLRAIGTPTKGSRWGTI